MNNLIKFKVFLIGFTVIYISNAIAADRILPLPKPKVEEEIKIKVSKNKEIYPKKKTR